MIRQTKSLPRQIMRLLAFVLFLLGALSVAAQTCNATLWKHVYHGPRFANARARLKPLKNCITVTGKIESASPERDGDYHIRLRVDPQFKKLLNAKTRCRRGHERSHGRRSGRRFLNWF